EVSVPVAGGGGTAARARAVQFLASAGHGAEGRSEELLETPHLLVDVGVALLAATVALGVCGIADPGGLLVRDPHHLGFREHALLFLSRLGDRPVVDDVGLLDEPLSLGTRPRGGGLGLTLRAIEQFLRLDTGVTDDLVR